MAAPVPTDESVRIVYFSNVSEYTKKFVDRLGLPAVRIPVRKAEPMPVVSDPYVLIVPTYGGSLEITGRNGAAVPRQVVAFLNDAHEENPALGLRGLRALQNEGVEHNALVMLTSHSFDKAHVIWDYLRGLGIDFLQFIPCLERDPATGEMSEYSVTPEQWGQFMCEVFDLWWESGTTAPGSDCPCPSTYVRLFNDLVEIYAGGEGPSCMLKDRCGEYVVIEHNGDVYPCDFFVDRDHYAGNILKTPLGQLIHADVLERFAVAKGNAGAECAECRWWRQCYGGCPKDRIYGQGHTECATYLCRGYQMLFEHADERLRRLAEHHRQQGGAAACATGSESQ